MTGDPQEEVKAVEITVVGEIIKGILYIMKKRVCIMFSLCCFSGDMCLSYNSIYECVKCISHE